MWIDITDKDRDEFNRLATHPLQSFEWGEFREKSGVSVIRKGRFEKNKLVEAFQLTIHAIPHTSWTIGYIPKGAMPTKQLLEELQRLGKEYKCIFIQLEPNIEKSQISNLKSQINSKKENTIDWNLGFGTWDLRKAAHPLFTKHTLQIDLMLSEEQLLSRMHQKARYNIKVAQKHGITVQEENTKEAFETYWQLTQQTTTRQQFFAHSKKYHMTQWEKLPHTITKNTLSSHLLIARYNRQPLTAWILFLFHDMLYYPYGASSNEHRETMHSTAMMWEAIRLGKKHHLKTFDLWGAASPNTPESDPWFGFTQFKERFGTERVEFIGSFDLVIHPVLYDFYKIADKVRWLLLGLK